MFPIIALSTLCLISAHVFDPELEPDYIVWSHRSPYQQETLIIDLYPHASTKVSVGTIECPINITWDPSKTLSTTQFSKHAKTCWNKRVAGSPELDDSKIIDLNNEQLMTLLYRNKVYNDGHVKIAYLAAKKTDKPKLYFDLPPVTPGENRCAAWHQEALHKSYTAKKKRYDETANYLIATGCDAAEFRKWPEHPKETRITVLKADEEALKVALANICMKLAQVHVELAKRLHERARTNRVKQVECARTLVYVKRLPDLPLFILPISDFIEIRDFLNQ